MKFLKLFSILGLSVFLSIGSVFASSDSFISADSDRNDFSLWLQANYNYYQQSYKRALDHEVIAVGQVIGKLKDMNELGDDTSLRMVVVSGALRSVESTINFKKYDSCPAIINGGSGLEAPDRVTRKPCTVIEVPQVDTAELRETLIASVLQAKSLYKEVESVSGDYQIDRKTIMERYKDRIKEFDEIRVQKQTLYSPTNFWGVVEKSTKDGYSLDILYRRNLVRTLYLEEPLMKDPVWSKNEGEMIIIVPDGFYVFYTEPVLFKFYGFEGLNNSLKHEDVFVTDTFVEFSPDNNQVFIVNDRGLFTDYFGVVINLRGGGGIVFNRALEEGEWNYNGRQKENFPWDEARQEQLDTPPVDSGGVIPSDVQKPRVYIEPEEDIKNLNTEPKNTSFWDNIKHLFSLLFSSF